MMATISDMTSLLAQFIQKINRTDISQVCGLTKGTNAATIKTTQQIVYFLYNQQPTLVPDDNIPMTPCAQQAAGTSCYYLVSVNINMVVTITKGIDNATALPATPVGQVAIAAILITTDSSHTFTSGTTDLGAVGITAQFFDLDCGMAPILINQAMRAMERKVNFRGMKARTPYALSANMLAAFDNPIPLYKELISVYGVDANNKRYAIFKHGIEEVEQAFADSQSGPPQLIAEVPKSAANLTPYTIPDLQWVVRPKPEQNYTLIFTAYEYTPYLDGVVNIVNWWTLNHPDLLLYASLVEALPYLKEDERVATWKTIADEKFKALVDAEQSQDYTDSRYQQGK